MKPQKSLFFPNIVQAMSISKELLWESNFFFIFFISKLIKNFIHNDLDIIKKLLITRTFNIIILFLIS